MIRTKIDEMNTTEMETFLALSNYRPLERQTNVIIFLVDKIIIQFKVINSHSMNKFIKFRGFSTTA